MGVVRASLVLALLAAVLSAGPASAQAPAAADTSGNGRPLLAILPFANNTGDPDAAEIFVPALHGALGRSRVTYLTAASLRPLLREQRIRSRGWIGRRGAEIIAAETGVRYLLLGSWDVLRRDGNVEAGFSLRVLDLESMALVAGLSRGGTGEDSVGWLDLGRVDDVATLTDTLLVRAVSDLVPFPPAPQVQRSWRGCNHLAVIPFDNFSETRHAGDVVTNILLSRLLAEGYFVVEPGFVRELGIAREAVVKGGVDRASARAIEEALGACRVVTGAVDVFEPARGDPSLSIPRIEVGLRVTSSASGNLYMIRNLQAAGDDKQSVFRLGRVYALSTLADKLLERFAQELKEANREDILNDPGRNPE
jgi:TolB-like protein